MAPPPPRGAPSSVSVHSISMTRRSRSRSRSRSRGSSGSWAAALLAAAAGALCLGAGPAPARAAAAPAAGAQATRPSHLLPTTAGFLHPSAPTPLSRRRRAAAAAATAGGGSSGGGSSSSASSGGSGGGSGSLESKKQRLVVSDALDFDAVVARQHDLRLREELAALPTLMQQKQQSSQSPAAAPAGAETDREVLARLTELFYHAMNERNAKVLGDLWLEDPSVVFFAGDEGGMTTGHGAVLDLLQKVRREERELDPAKKGLMLHPPVEPSGMRAVVNGMHAWVTCKETMPRGLTKEHTVSDHFLGTNVFRRFNGQWRLVMHWSGRLAPIQEQLQEMLEQKRMKEQMKAQGGKGMPGMQQRIPLRPEDLGLPPGMPLNAEAEITWEWDEDDDDEDDDEGITIVGGDDDGEGLSFEAGVAGLLDTWDRSAVFRKKTKKALGAVRRLAKEGRITRIEKIKLIHSVIASTSQDEISQVEMAYDLLVKRGFGDLEEFADQCKMIVTDIP